jgi:hypothetical protein
LKTLVEIIVTAVSRVQRAAVLQVEAVSGGEDVIRFAAGLGLVPEIVDQHFAFADYLEPIAVDDDGGANIAVPSGFRESSIETGVSVAPKSETNGLVDAILNYWAADNARREVRGI